MNLQPYKRLNKLLENETFEPAIAWGFRMAIAAMVPMLWGISTGQTEAAQWITLTAECICWVELKGSFGQRMRILAGGTVIAVLFSILGSISGSHLWLSVLLMLPVGFLSGLFKNLGDRGSGLAICVFVVFIITNAYPVHNAEELRERVLLTATGGLWNMLVGVVASVFIPAQEPYRRTIALIWKANVVLVNEIARGWDGKSLRSNIRKIYLREKEVRAAIDHSLLFYERLAHQVSKADKDEYELAQLRKTTALVATHLEAISEELDSLKVRETDEGLRLKLAAALKSMSDVMERMAVYVIMLKPEEELLVSSRMSRLYKNITLLKDHPIEENSLHRHQVRRIVQLLERTGRLVDSSIVRLQKLGDDRPVYRSYSLIKTLFVLHPTHWWRNLKLLFNFNTFTVNYALRSAAAATVAMLIFKWTGIERGFWLPFTVIIVLQPYFGATFKKAIDRVVGTVAGGLAGGLLISLPAALYAKEIMLFISFVLMVYFIRKRYAVAAFFITLSLVLVFNIEDEVTPAIILTRALATMGGAALAILAGFALLPEWDRKWLPVHITTAINCNYHYFLATFFSPQPLNWVKYKRNAESKNSNAFDSFNRYMSEPAIGKRPYIPSYQIITHNVRVTRELNNIHLEQESRRDDSLPATPDQQVRINECLLWFNRNIGLIKSLNPKIDTTLRAVDHSFVTPFCLTSHQSLYLNKLLYELKSVNQGLHQLQQTPERIL
jgi:uncharacterized membrane protein YccC